MTQEDKRALRDRLYDAHEIGDYKQDDPFVGIYFDSLVELMDDYKNGKLYPTDGIYEVETKPLEGTIEYVRKDAFIEKACEWLSKHARKYYFNKDGRYLGTDELVEDFKFSMEL